MKKFKKLKPFKCLLGLLFLTIRFQILGDDESSSATYYRSSTVDHGVIQFSDHFRFSDQQLTFSAPQDWMPIYNNQGEMLIQYLTRDGKATIEVFQMPLGPSPIDEKSALELYQSKIEKMAEPHFIKDARVRDVDMPIAFPQTYMLAKSEKDPPTKMVTYLSFSPYLYQISIEVKDRLTGDFRTTYGNLLQSINFESLSTLTVEGNPPPESPVQGFTENPTVVPAKISVLGP